ncbi:IPTL-CTERM sorting domain-containing protein, partial [SAR202 cluster bacterium AC-647-N09_OGT_505m]|nr:IPTL-CTERM sorting domain-containing protein [SAR202 cluster bacterium AC-647-N09_OGT_505m]
GTGTSLIFKYQGNPTIRNNNFVHKSETYLVYDDRNVSENATSDFENNWWGTTNTTNLDALIYDWNDNATKEMIDYTPFLTAPDTTAPPSPPANVATQTGPTTISLAWDANPESDITGYKVHYDTDAAGYPYANSIDIGNVTSYTLSGLSTDTTYYTAVSAYDADGNESWISSNTTATTESVPTALAFSTQPSGATAGNTFTTQPVVVIQGSAENTVTTATDSVTISITSGTGGSGATLLGTATVSAVNGVATFTDLRIDKAATGYTLTATSSSLTLATSASFDVSSSATASRLVVISEPSTTAAGETFVTQPVIQIQDVYGNIVTSSSASVTVSITSGTGTSGAALSGSAAISAASGVATFSGLGIDSAGSNYTLTATASGLTSDASSPFDVVVAATPIPAMSTWGLIVMALLVSAWMAHMARRGRSWIDMK